MARVVLFGNCPKTLIKFRGPLLHAMKEKGHDVIACAPYFTPESESELQSGGISYRPVHLNRTGLNPLDDLKTIYQLRRLLLQTEPDVAFFYMVKPIIYGSIAARLTGTQNIFSMIEGLGYVFSGGDTKRRLLARLIQSLYSGTLRLNRGIFVLNRDDAEEITRWRKGRQRERIHLLPGIGVDLTKFTPGPYPRSVSFLMLTRLLKDKGVEEYAAAARQLKKRYPQARFKLAGAIDDNPGAIGRAQLDGWINEGSIEYLGVLPDVRPAIREASVKVLPSYREGLPLSVLEGMAMARPIVTTDAPGCRETVSDGVNGTLVPVRCSHSLASAMERYIVDPSIIPEQGRASRRIAEERYDVHRINEEILRILGLD